MKILEFTKSNLSHFYLKSRNLGECILLNGMVYSSRTDISRSERDPLMWGPEFVTSGIFLIPKNTAPNLKLEYFSFHRADTLSDLYQEIYKKVKRPFALVGNVELAEIYAESITKAPIDNINIFENTNEYYTEKKYIDTDVNLTIAAVVSDPNDKKLNAINKKLSSVLYFNPFADKTKLLTHTHALVLNKPILHVEQVEPKHAKEVLHLLDSSKLRYVNLKVYIIDDIDCLA